MDLWEHLQGRARLTDETDNLAGSMSYAEVKGSTSAAVGSSEEGSVFDVTIDNFESLRKEAESLLVDAIKSAFPATFKPYYTSSQWATVDEDPFYSVLPSVHL